MFQLSTTTKCAALAAVEASRTFERHDQLRAFLRFVCEYEMEGRGEDLHEYLIGVEVLGQKPGYSTTENSVVRNRAHSLRKKLAEFYAGEGAGEAVRIEIPKGAYCPHFIQREETANDPIETKTVPEAPGTRKRLPFWWVAGALIAGCLCVALGFRWGQSRATAVDPILREAWGPLLNQDAQSVICIANAPELFVRSLPDDLAKFKRLPDELDLMGWFKERNPIASNELLYIVPNHNSPLWGDAAGAITMGKLLARSGVDTLVLPERVQSAFALRDRNAILLGRPEISPAARVFLKDMYYNVHYSSAARDQVVYATDPATGISTDLPRKSATVHGLITVINEVRNDGVQTRLVNIAGENSAGTLAAAEFFSCASCLRTFKSRLATDGITSLPSIYQIVIRTELNENLPFNYEFEAYRVIRK